MTKDEQIKQLEQERCVAEYFDEYIDGYEIGFAVEMMLRGKITFKDYADSMPWHANESGERVFKCMKELLDNKCNNLSEEEFAKAREIHERRSKPKEIVNVTLRDMLKTKNG